jgi:hypothetical protein
MTKHVRRSLGQCLEMALHIREQEREIATLMIMRDYPPRDAPEPRECRLASGSYAGV